jgi:hypothetical protein
MVQKIDTCNSLVIILSYVLYISYISKILIDISDPCICCLQFSSN